MLDLISYSAQSPEKIKQLKDRLDAQRSKGKGVALDNIVRTVIHQQREKDGDDIISISLARKLDWQRILSEGASTLTAPESTSEEGELREAHSELAQATSKPAPRLTVPPRIPILVAGLQKILEHEQVKHNRYFQGPLSDEDSEALVKKYPRNIEHWINYAVQAIPTSLTYDDLEKHSSGLHKAMNILSRALQANRNSEALWNFYLELYCRQASQEDVRETFEQAVSFIPDSIQLWWRWFSWETAVGRKEVVLSRMINALILSPETAQGGRSHLVEVLVDATIELHITRCSPGCSSPTMCLVP